MHFDKERQVFVYAPQDEFTLGNPRPAGEVEPNVYPVEVAPELILRAMDAHKRIMESEDPGLSSPIIATRRSAIENHERQRIIADTVMGTLAPHLRVVDEAEALLRDQAG